MLIWIIYFWIAAVIAVLSAVGRVYLFLACGIVTPYDLMESLVALFAVVGLYGFAYQTPIATPTLWKVAFVLLAGTWLWGFFAAKNSAMIDKLGMAKGGAALAIIQMLAVPGLVGLSLYTQQVCGNDSAIQQVLPADRLRQLASHQSCVLRCGLLIIVARVDCKGRLHLNVDTLREAGNRAPGDHSLDFVSGKQTTERTFTV
jgi:hypothetical protein